MDEFTQLKKEKIYKTLSNLGEDISLTEWSDTQWYELRGYSTEEARQMVFENTGRNCSMTMKLHSTLSVTGRPILHLMKMKNSTKKNTM